MRATYRPVVSGGTRSRLELVTMGLLDHCLTVNTWKTDAWLEQHRTRLHTELTVLLIDTQYRLAEIWQSPTACMPPSPM